MDVKTALNLIDDLSFKKTKKRLTDLARNIFKETWEGKTSDQIAASCNCSVNYVKENWFNWWRLLSEELGEKVNKSNYKGALERLNLKRNKYTINYQFGGTLAPNHTTYIRRKTDDQLYQTLKAGKFCYIFDARQTGKSSLALQTMNRLKEDGFVCVFIDLSAITIQSATEESFYIDQILTIKDNLQLNFNQEEWFNENRFSSDLQRFTQFLKDILLIQVKENIVIFIDEIDSVLGSNFPTDDFFAFIRSCYNERANNPEYKRLNFCLIGVASPDDLIKDKKRTPFNIGVGIELKPFQIDEVEPLIKPLKEKFPDNAQNIMKEILDWTGGQPFLTQKLCGLMFNESDQKNFLSVEDVVTTKIIDNWQHQDHPTHLNTIQDRIYDKINITSDILEIYRRILSEEKIETDLIKREQIQLILSGLVVNENGFLKVYNRIYKTIFNLKWIEDQVINIINDFRSKLRDKTADSDTLIKEIKRWTRLKLFLVSELLNLIEKNLKSIPFNKEPEWLENLIEENWLKNWQKNKLAKHFLSIEEELLNNKTCEPFWLLLQYAQILLEKQTKFDDSLAQKELLKLNLIFQDAFGNIEVFNPIYANIFDKEWLKKNLTKIQKDHAINFLAWLNNKQFKDSINSLENKLSDDDKNMFEKIKLWINENENLMSYLTENFLNKFVSQETLIKLNQKFKNNHSTFINEIKLFDYDTFKLEDQQEPKFNLIFGKEGKILEQQEFDQLLDEILIEAKGNLEAIIIFDLSEGLPLYHNKVLKETNTKLYNALFGELEDLGGEAIEGFNTLNDIQEALNNFGEKTQFGDLNYSIFKLAKGTMMVYFHKVSDIPTAIFFIASEGINLGNIIRSANKNIDKIKQKINEA